MPRELGNQQCPCGPDVPAQMDGGITISNLKMTYDKQLEAEIAFRKIQLEKPYARLTAKEKKDLLRMDEMKH